jgi:lipopolysaccharide/colanic/teichoic acid biosynthesis glycosyltransferase
MGSFRDWNCPKTPHLARDGGFKNASMHAPWSQCGSAHLSPYKPDRPIVIRTFDLLLSFLGLVFLSPALVCLWILGWFDNRSPLFRQHRVGLHQQPFVLVKFRTMRPDTASVATHLADASAVTGFGRFLRRTKLDELPQLWNVLKSDMSLVGPRPCLFNQEELIIERAQRGVFNARPGITGLAQIQGIDMSTPELLAKTDAEMLESLNLISYFRYIFLTVLGKGSGDRVREKST